MQKIIDRDAIRRRIRYRIRKRLAGTTGRPRLAVFRSDKHIYAQVIDDGTGTTVVSASSRDKALKGLGGKNGGNVEAAKAVGSAIASRLKERGIENVVFDRGGYLYHGRIKALAEAAREAGLKF
ncbi:MAG TPA: 50S ribosomal protein L18 [Candidatus Polarisedimenticolaceae bacterium]|nr:50S ribosomal protein L18 [Candidatus Polarisedimenticolaceae bacterium]